MNGMNNRIQKLAEQCESFGSWDNKTYSFDKEKFAELIIDICIDLVEEGVDHREPASTYADKIREHFGIETVNDTIRRRSTYFGNNP